ncbi:MAG: hypothetical protein AB8B61_09590 [Cyclobacteriaceae bacterium]
MIGKRTTTFFIKLDEWISKSSDRHKGMIFLIIKDKSILREGNSKKSLIKKMLNFSVPYHYLSK